MRLIAPLFIHWEWHLVVKKSVILSSGNTNWSRHEYSETVFEPNICVIYIFSTRHIQRISNGICSVSRIIQLIWNFVHVSCPFAFHPISSIVETKMYVAIWIFRSCVRLTGCQCALLFVPREFLARRTMCELKTNVDCHVHDMRHSALASHAWILTLQIVY